MIFGPRSLFTMAVLLLALAGLYAVQRRATPSHREPPKPREKIGGRWEPKEVHAFQLFHGDKEHDSLVLERTADGWILRDRAPLRADSAAIDRFLDALKDLEGEKREVGGKEAFKRLGLDDESAIRILLVDQNRRPLLNLAVGVRADASGGTFVRLGDGETVWLSAKDLREAVGADRDGHLGRKRWLDLAMVGLRADEIDHLTLRGPENILVLERREKPDPSDSTKIVSEWVLVAPALPVEPKPAEVAAIPSSFAGLRAEDVPDPSKIEKSGLATPAFEATAKLKGGQEVRVFFGSVVPGMEGQRYAKVAGRDQVYAVSKWDLQDVFRPIGRLADLPGLGGSKDRIVRVALRDAWKEVTFLREVTGTWRLEPHAPLAVRVDELLEMVGAALEAKPADLLTGVADEAAGLARPESELSMEDSDGRKVGIRLGSVRAGNEQQRYVRMSNYEGVVALSTQSVSGIFPGLRQLLDLRPLILDREQIRSILVETAGGRVLLERGEPWKATVRDVAFDARKSGVDRLRSLAADFRPADIATRAATREPESTVRFHLVDGREISLRIGRLDEAGKELFARVGEDPLVYRITHFEFELATFSISDLADLTWPPSSALARASGGVVSSEKGEQAVSKESLKPLKVVAVVAPDPDSGIEEAKERLTVVLQGADPLVLTVGGEARGQPGSRYARVEGSEALLLLREDEVAELFKPVR
jgi:hypothetical protein